MSENHNILHYMDDVFNKIIRAHNSNVIIVNRNPTKLLKTNMLLEQAQFSYSNISSFADKIKVVMSKILKDEPVESIRLKGSKSGEIFVTFDDNLDIIVFDKW
ncbi:hypothetical protein ACKWTF_007585 [Chironomus riparius]